MKSEAGFAGARRAVRTIAVIAAAIALGGCLGEPKIEDRWTRLDIRTASLVPNQQLTGMTALPVTVRAAVTYRRIVTGFYVAELRVSPLLNATNTRIQPDANREIMAQDIDRLLPSSVTLGRATRAITGWDHLIQEIDFSFTGVVPPAGSGGVFLVCYLGSGVEVERQDGTDTLIVTPFNSIQNELLPIGMAFTVGP